MSSGKIRRVLLGAPMHTGEAPHQRLNKLVALPVFSSDALSSVAYATQEAMIALALAGSAAFRFTLPVCLTIVGLLIVLTISYNQTIHAYPNGGGAYIVARENLGMLAAKVAAVALLTDYVLTVAVSVASGIDAVLSAYPAMDHLPVRLALNACATLFIMLMNLRGVRESGAAFALPTYCFIFSLLTLIGVGIWQIHTGGMHHLNMTPTHVYHTQHLLFWWVVLQAFASGCTAVTGVEAISNGIPAFKAPESHNAAVTMAWMAGLLGTMFVGVTYLAQQMAAVHHIVPSDSGETVISQLAHALVGSGAFYYVIQWSTFLILVLAANTSFADFPRLSAIAARDGQLPRWMGVLGDRLVFQNGIISLAVLAIILEMAFRGSTDALIPLYAIGVFVAFTLSQAGMVNRWRRLRPRGWQLKTAVNGVGASLTALVAVVFAVVKFHRGAWVVLILIPLMVFLLTHIDQHYQFMKRRLSVKRLTPGYERRPSLAVVLVGNLEPNSLAAIEYARLISRDVRALNVSRRGEAEGGLEREWSGVAPDIPLAVVNEPRHGWIGALMDELYHLRSEDRSRTYTVVLPRSLESAAETRRRRASRGAQIPWLLKWMLLHEPGVAVADVAALVLPAEKRSDATGSNGHAATAASPAFEEPTAGEPVAVLDAAPVGPAAMELTGAAAVRREAAGLESRERATLMRRGAPGLAGASAYRRDRHTILVLTPALHRGIVEAIGYARELSGQLRALHIELEPHRTEELREGWERWAEGIPLLVLESPYRQLREPLLHYIAAVRRQAGTDVLSVVVPEFVATRWWDKVLHNQSGLLLKFALRNQPGVVVVNTRYFLGR